MLNNVKKFFKIRVLDPLLAQLKKGATAEKLSLSCAFGFAVGIFPIYGTSMILGVILGFIFRLNHIALQIANYSLQALQIILIPVFLYYGDLMFGKAPLPFSLEVIKLEFNHSPRLFFEKFGYSLMHAFVLWLLVVLVLIPVSYLILLPIFRRLRGGLRSAH